MLHSDERNQLAALHDQPKKFSIEVYDYLESSQTKKQAQAVRSWTP